MNAPQELPAPWNTFASECPKPNYIHDARAVGADLPAAERVAILEERLADTLRQLDEAEQRADSEDSRADAASELVDEKDDVIDRLRGECEALRELSHSVTNKLRAVIAEIEDEHAKRRNR